MFIYYVAMSFIFSYNLKADLSSPHREDSNDTILTFSDAVFRFPYTANNAVNAKFRVRGRVTSKGLRGTALRHQQTLQPRAFTLRTAQTTL